MIQRIQIEEKRYSRNFSALTIEEQSLLSRACVGVCGCGGIGGYVVEMLARIGIGTLVLIDCDSFDETNLNRQILASEKSIGCRKVQVARERVLSINSCVNIVAFDERITDKNIDTLLRGCDVVVDALDSFSTRFQVEKWCEGANVVMVHGAIGGWYAQVSTIAPVSGSLAKIYPDEALVEVDKSQGNPSFTPAFAASLEVSECIKVLTGKGNALYGKLLVADLLHGTQRVIDLS